MLDWWKIETATADGLLAVSEMTELALLEVADRVADRRARQRWERDYKLHRQTIPVPKQPSELDVLAALSDAIEQSDDYWRRFGLRVNRDENSHEHLFGCVTYDLVAAVLAGLPIGQGWKVKYGRRVVPALGKLVSSGLVCRGDRDGIAYGYELTPDGEAMLRDAELLAA